MRRDKGGETMDIEVAKGRPVQLRIDGDLYLVERIDIDNLSVEVLRGFYSAVVEIDKETMDRLIQEWG